MASFSVSTSTQHNGYYVLNVSTGASYNKKVTVSWSVVFKYNSSGYIRAGGVQLWMNGLHLIDQAKNANGTAMHYTDWTVGSGSYELDVDYAGNCTVSYNLNGMVYNYADVCYTNGGADASRTIGSSTYGFNLNILDPNGAEPGQTGTAGTVALSVDGAAYERVSDQPSKWANLAAGVGIRIKDIQPGTGMRLSSVSGASLSGGVYSTIMEQAAKTVTIQMAWNNYTITFDKQGGSGGTDSVSIAYNTATGSYPSITLPTRNGYTFTGYYTGTEESGTQYYDSAGNGVRPWQIASNTTLYAGWSMNPPSEMNITYVEGRVDSFTTQLSAFSAGAITNYTLYYRKKGSSNWITKDLGTNATAFVGLGLETDTDYELKFSATNAGGTTTSDIFTFSTLMTTPSLTSFEISNLLPFSFTIIVEGTSNPERVISYAFSKDGGATWSSYQALGTYNFTGLNEETSYDVGVSVKAKALGVNASDTEYIETKVVVTPADQAKIRIKKDGIWKKGKAYYKKDGKWVKAKKIYIKVDGQWKINNNYDS